MAKKKNESVRLRSSLLGGALVLSLGITAAMPMATGTRSYQEHSHIDEGGYINLETGKIEYTLPGIATRYLWKLPQRTLTVNGKKLSDPAMMMNGILYLPLEAFAKSLGNANVSYNSSTKTATLSMSGLYLTAIDSGFVTYANDRPLFSFSPNVVMSNGKMYVPAEALTKALGVQIKSKTSSEVTVSGTFKPLTDEKRRYDKASYFA